MPVSLAVMIGRIRAGPAARGVGGHVRRADALLLVGRCSASAVQWYIEVFIIQVAHQVESSSSFNLNELAHVRLRRLPRWQPESVGALSLSVSLAGCAPARRSTGAGTGTTTTLAMLLPVAASLP